VIVVDATPLYDLGQIGELDLLGEFDDLVVPSTVAEEVTVEPAATNLERFLGDQPIETDPDVEDDLETARALLDEDGPTSDAVVVACLLAAREADRDRGLVSDDRRLRAVADGLGATVTGTFGVVVRASAADKYFPTSQAKRVIRRTDDHGVQMTGRLRERAIGEVDG
jgi:predicted nucleic acid-binding protein